MARSETTDTTPSYEEARDELSAIVRQLESGNVPLSEAMALWERGEKLADICQSWLDGATAKLADREKPAGPAEV
ncbi:MAG: exodeoxyribonuclease VII small subunit [Actinobacteria bacterium]|nr:exodeoxyribonuclease VII small subunit [Actinomycetota bacterium]